jgi:lycopene cyclase domain-containing protein
MTYSLFLLLFLGIPIVVLFWSMRRHLSRRHLAWIAVLMTVALVYTTPWDNYLVASRVWWYDPSLVLGITVGWVPIEEYTFFLVQPLMVGLWTLAVSRFVAACRPVGNGGALRIAATSALGLLWLASALVLLRGWMPGNYLALILVWALPPIALQTAFGADILWSEWRRVALGLAPAVLYLSLADAIAIRSGTWTINPERSLELYLGSVLPFEEFIFFLVTNVLIVFSMVLLLSEQSRERLGVLFNRRETFTPLPDQT